MRAAGAWASCSAGRGAVTVSWLVLVGSVLLWTLLVLLGLLLLLLLPVLFLPFTFYVQADADLAGDDWEDDLSGPFRGKFGLRWGIVTVSGMAAGEGLHLERTEFRLLGMRMDGRKRARKGRRKGENEGAGAPRGTPTGDGPPRRKVRLKLTPDLIWALTREALSLPERVWRSLGIRLSGELTYGFSDPSLTGFCEAIRWGTGVALPVRLTPDFLRPCLIGWGRAGGRVFGYKLVAIGWRVLRRPAIWNYLVGQIRFRPLRSVLLQGGT